MASVKFLSFHASHFGTLMPAPSVLEIEKINMAAMADPSPRLEVVPDNLVNKKLKIIADYRGGLMYLEGGLTIHRFDPKTGGVNGYTDWPIEGTIESVKIGDWIAEVEFV